MCGAVQLQTAFEKKNKVASKDSAAREASARYNARMTLLKEKIIGAIPMSEVALQLVYDEQLLRACAELSDGDPNKHEKIMQSLKADLAPLMVQLKTINLYGIFVCVHAHH